MGKIKRLTLISECEDGSLKMPHPKSLISLTEFLSLNARNRTQGNVIGNNKQLKWQNLSNVV